MGLPSKQDREKKTGQNKLLKVDIQDGICSMQREM